MATGKYDEVIRNWEGVPNGSIKVPFYGKQDIWEYFGCMTEKFFSTSDGRYWDDFAPHDNA